VKNVIIVTVSALLTSVGLLYWLHDGDLEEAVEPILEQWVSGYF
jgi:hypothetical protein